MELKGDIKARNLVRENAVFSNLSDPELDALLGITERKIYKKNAQVFHMEQKAKYFFIVESGLFILSLKGKRYKTFRPGDLFGEIAIINEKVRTGTIRALEDSTLLSINGEQFFDEQFLHPRVALKVTRELAKKVTSYLRSREQITTRELIDHGENDLVEFKSSLRWNPQKEHKDKLIEFAVLKTICAFLNTKGGTLIVGVNDEKQVIGIGQDRFDNLDQMLLHLTKLIKEHISPLHIEFLKFEVEPIDDEYILRVDCEAATAPAYMKERNEEIFYVRTGPSTSHLKVSKVYDYIRRRFY